MSTDTISKLLAGLTHITWQSAVMMAIGGLLIFLAIAKEYEPLLLLPIGAGAILTDRKGAEIAAAVAGRGHATLVKGEGGPVFPPEAPEVAALVAGLRAKFDPRGILNVGMMG